MRVATQLKEANAVLVHTSRVLQYRVNYVVAWPELLPSVPLVPLVLSVEKVNNMRVGGRGGVGTTLGPRKT